MKERKRRFVGFDVDEKQWAFLEAAARKLGNKPKAMRAVLDFAMAEGVTFAKPGPAAVRKAGGA